MRAQLSECRSTWALYAGSRQRLTGQPGRLHSVSGIIRDTPVRPNYPSMKVIHVVGVSRVGFQLLAENRSGKREVRDSQDEKS